MTERLYIAAKAPRPGVAKTRLGRDIGDEGAVALYKAFLSDLAARFARTPFTPVWYVTPPDAWPDIAPLVGEGSEDRVAIQAGDDWTERQRRLFLEAAARGEERILLLASDSPQLTVEVVEKAFRELDRHDLVFGPTHDGGYYLIGMRATTVPHDVLGGIPMSTDTVLASLVGRAVRVGLSVGWTETTFDIDRAEDLAHLRRLTSTRPDLAATHAVLEELGLGPAGIAGAGPRTGAREPEEELVNRAGADPTPENGEADKRITNGGSRFGLRPGVVGRGRSPRLPERAWEEGERAW